MWLLLCKLLICRYFKPNCKFGLAEGHGIKINYMKNIYYYIYYKQYKALSKTNKEIPEWASMILLSQLICFNLNTIFIIFNFTKTSWFILFAKPFSVGLIILLLVINFFIFIKDDRYQRIITKYQNETKQKSLIGGSLVAIYVFGSIYLFLNVLGIV